MKKYYLRIIGLLTALIGMIAAGDYYSKFHQALNRDGFVYQGTALGILFGLLILVLGGAALAFEESFQKWIRNYLDELKTKQHILKWVIIIPAALTYEGVQDILFLGAEMEEIHYQGYRKLLATNFSLLLMASLIGFLLLGLFLFWYRDQVKGYIQKRFDRKTGLIFLGVVILFLVLEFLPYGIKPGSEDTTIFQPPNAPLLGIQVLLYGVLIQLGITAWNQWSDRFPRLRRVVQKNWVIMLIIWSAAFLIWYQTPLGPNYYIDQPRYPNQTLYPSSDPVYFDIQGLLFSAGQGLSGKNLDPTSAPRHPLYTFYLAILHGVSGIEYLDIIPLQVAILSLIPVLLFVLVEGIHSQFSGLVVSGLFILRERNALLLSEHITVSTVKVLMTEPLTLLSILLFLVLFLKWSENPRQRLKLLPISGAVLGAAMLIRVEMVILFPAALLGAYVCCKQETKTYLRWMLFFGVSMVLMVVPWMIRNQIMIGKFTIDRPGVVRGTLERVFQPDQEIPSEVKDVFDSENEQGTEPPLGGTHPDYVVNNIKQTFYYLPNNHQPLLTAGSIAQVFNRSRTEMDLEGDSFSEKYLERYVRSLPYWWYQWDGDLLLRSYLPIILSLLLISTGLRSIPPAGLWVILVTGLLILLNALIYAVIGYSGGRFLVTVEWISLMYFGIGLAVFIQDSPKVSLTGEKQDPGDHQHQPDHFQDSYLGQRNLWLVLVFVLMAGMVLPISEGMLPDQYQQSELDLIWAEVQSDLPEMKSAYLELEARDLDPVIAYGRVIYPRFFKANRQVEDDRKGSLPDSSYKRIEFFFLGTESAWAAVPGNRGREYFPSGERVLILGTWVSEKLDQNGDSIYGRYLKAERVLFLDKISEDQSLIKCANEICDLSWE